VYKDRERKSASRSKKMDCIGKGSSRRNFFKEESNFHVKETATETGQGLKNQEGPHDGIATRIIIIYVAARYTLF
jgi:hypothetical protein